MKSLSSRLMDTRLLGAPWRELSILSATNDISHPYLTDPQGKIRFTRSSQNGRRTRMPGGGQGAYPQLVGTLRLSRRLCRISQPLGPCSRAMRISGQITHGKDVTPWAKASTRNIVPSV